MMQLISIDDASLNAWRQDDLISAMESLSQETQGADHHRLANLALVRARLKQWDMAERDARASIQVQPTILAHIAVSIALGGQGKLASAKQEFNRVFLLGEPRDECLLLLIKSIIILEAGEHDEAMRRVTDIAEACTETDKVLCRTIQLLVGQTALNERDYERALKSSASAASVPFSEPPELETISLMFGWDFNFLLLQQTCEALYMASRLSEAVESLQSMLDDLGAEVKTSVRLRNWVDDFKLRCLETLEQHGTVAMDSASYEDAVDYYTAALALDPLSTNFLTKRSKARAGIGSWQDSLEDADAAIKLDPSSPHGYEGKHAALLGARRYDEAIDAYNDMLLKLEQSPDPVTRESRKRYVSPSQTVVAIRNSVKQSQRNAPLVLIDTETGRLHDKQERLDVFEADPACKELVASMTTGLDDSRIMQTVQQYFRYGTFSHTWQEAEPLFHDVLYRSVYELAASPAAFKLEMFCATVREAGLRWAWSDTCCIDKADLSVLQESLTLMFRWYQESALTVVHLLGVLSDSEPGALERSLWNTRAWTLQHFVASRVIRFYTEDWKPYLPQESVYNHKDSSTIMVEMAAATGVDVQVLLSLRPGPENVRRKLSLAAARIATREEDIAYSLFGIFDVFIPVTYGEGRQRALCRLLQEVLTRSGNVTILAWTGEASDYNSCLPAEIGVYREPSSPYLPSPIEDDKLVQLVAELRSSSYLDSAVLLYDRVIVLPSPRLVSRRLSLPCIVFPLRGLSVESDQGVYRVMTSAFGKVEIKTTEDLSSLKNLVLIHPWLQCLLDPALPSEDLTVDNDDEPLTPIDEDSGDNDSDALSPTSARTSSQPYDKVTRALRLFAHLRQPFGALLLAPLSHNEYKRVACDHPILVQLLENVSPRYLAQKIQTLDIL